MAVAQGYGKIVTSGSVFAYDVGDTRNSYIGEPTTNLVTSPFEINNTTSTDIPQELIGKGITGYASYNSNYSVFAISTTSTSSTGKTFQYSIWMRSPGGVSTYLLYVYDGTGPDGGWWSFGEGALTDEWQRITGSRSNMTGTVSNIRVYRRNQQGTIEMVAPQLEVKSHVTPFTTGTRSATQGLLDLTGNSTIDLANVSFDANAQIVFDGTDDVITVPMDNLRPTSAITQEVVVYIDNNTTQVWIGSQYGTSSGNSYALWLNSANTLQGGVNTDGSLNNQGVTFAITVDKWYHFVHTYDGITQRLYANGTEVHSWNTSGTIIYNSNNTLLAVGNDWNGSGYNVGASLGTHGKQDITKIYSRALTAAEVKQNYLHYKTRFNLS